MPPSVPGTASVTQIRYPSGREVDYAHDGAGRISGAQLTLPGGTPQNVVSGITYLPFGPATSYSFDNGQTLTKTYDQDYRIQNVTSPALALAFDLDAVGNIVASGPSTGSWNETYGYDDLYRLTDVLDGAGLIQFDRFAYDATGNRVERQMLGGPVVPYAYPVDSHRLASVDGAPRNYDAMGNTLDGIGFQSGASYGDNGRLVLWTQAMIGDTAYLYNGRGERVLKAPVVQFCMGVCPGEIFVYDEAGRLLGEYTTFGSARQEHIWVDDTPVAMVNEVKDEVFYVHSDHLNTPRALTAKEGILRWRWAFQANAFGELAADSDPMSTGEPVEYKLRFPGQYFDAESGLHYNYFRDYEPGTGRYVESDPIGLAGGLSTYSYVGANPLVFLDEQGEFRIRAEERAGIGGNYQWVYWFDFDGSCAWASVRNSTTRGFRLGRRLMRAGGFFGESSAGDNDIDDIVDWCRCLNADPHLRDQFRSWGYRSATLSSAATTFSEEEARGILNDIRREFNAYVDANCKEDCQKLKVAYPWNQLVDLARQRGRQHISRRFGGVAR